MHENKNIYIDKLLTTLHYDIGIFVYCNVQGLTMLLCNILHIKYINVEKKQYSIVIHISNTNAEILQYFLHIKQADFIKSVTFGSCC